MIWVRLRHLPPESSTQIHLNGDRIPWGWTEYLLADLWSLQTEKRHPDRPQTTQQKQKSSAFEAERQRRLARKRRRERQRQTTTEE